MNICDLALLLALIFILGFPLTGGFTKNIEINREKIELKKRSQSFQFIAQSFRHTCSDSGFSNLE